MLKTLDRYIDERADRVDVFASPWTRLGRERRFTLLFSISIVAHIVFYVVLIKLDAWALMQIRGNSNRPSDVVKFVEIAPRPDHIPLRRAPEALERADVSKLHFDPANADDIHLIPRSPKPSEQRGSGGKLPSADQLERQLRSTARGLGGGRTIAKSASRVNPPMTSAIQPSRLGNLEESRIAQLPPTQATTTPPAPPVSDAPVPRPGPPDPAAAGTRRGSSSESTSLGLEAAQAQYMAYVRAKISKVNERIMPRDWIKDVLREKASADFELIIRRDGQVLSMRLLHGSGYSVLDASARQAIYTASPFEGFPQIAGNTLIFTVTVHFFTL